MTWRATWALRRARQSRWAYSGLSSGIGATTAAERLEFRLQQPHFQVEGSDGERMPLAAIIARLFKRLKIRKHADLRIRLQSLRSGDRSPAKDERRTPV